MIGIRGIHSTIAKSLIEIIDDHIVEIDRNFTVNYLKVNKYFICQGLLYGKKRLDQTGEEVSQTYKVNYTQVACMCESILSYNSRARICVIGSESGIVGSYDEIYADSKRLLHYFVETKRVGPNQQLVCVAPTIIIDSEMTARRTDIDNLFRLRENHPKGRFLSSMEVAKVVKFLLYDDLGYITNTVIRMNGGSHIR